MRILTLPQRIAVLSSVLAVCMTNASLAIASPLDEKSCEQLGVERDSLRNLGIEKDIEKGPVWARTNLAASDLTLIKLFIEINERIKFRCAGNTAPPAPVAAAPVVKAVAAFGGLDIPPLPVKRGVYQADAGVIESVKKRPRPQAKPPVEAKKDG